VAFEFGVLRGHGLVHHAARSALPGERDRDAGDLRIGSDRAAAVDEQHRLLEDQLATARLRSLAHAASSVDLAGLTATANYFDLKKSVAGEAVGFVGDSTPSRSG